MMNKIKRYIKIKVLINISIIYNRKELFLTNLLMVNSKQKTKALFMV